MSRSYIYTVTSKLNGSIVAQGSVEECAKATGLNRYTLRDMAVSDRGTYTTSARMKYIVTREWGEYEPSSNAKYYSIYCKKTDAILASGTSAECAKQMGWKNTDTFHRTMTREKHTGRTGYEFYSEPYYEEETT